MENPDATKADFDDIFKEIMANEETGVNIFGAAGEIANTSPELFRPRSVLEFKQELETKGKDSDEVTEFDILLSDLSGSHAERYNKILGNMTDSEFVTHYERLLNYVKPKFKSIDPVIPQSNEYNQINVTVVNTKPSE